MVNFSFASNRLVSTSLRAEGIAACAEGNEQFKAVAMKCTEACKRVATLYHENPVQADLVPSFNALKAWPFIVSAYSGIEQSTKALLRMSGIQYPSTGRAGHRLDSLFGKLPHNERFIVHESFEIYQSFHYYITFSAVDDFLKSISTGFGHTGYDDWRYMLMDFQSDMGSVRVPMNHTGAMLEIWSTLTDILIAKTYEDCPLDTVADRINHAIASCLNDAAGSRSNDTHFQEIFQWYISAGNLITGYADYYHNNLRNKVTAFPITEHVAIFLEDSLQYAKQLMEKDQDFNLFLALAERGLVTWNESTKRFNLSF